MMPTVSQRTDNKMPIQVNPVTIDSLGETAAIISNAFGISQIGQAIFTTKVVDTNTISDREISAQKESTDNKYLSPFSLPVFDAVSFKGGSYYDAHLVAQQYTDVHLPMAIITIDMNKTVIKTPTVGRTFGTVKEYVNDGDFTVNIRGVIASGVQNLYPDYEVEKLFKMLMSTEPVAVYGNWFTRFGIESIVIERFSIPQEEAMRDIQRFEIQAVSTLPIVLEKNN